MKIHHLNCGTFRPRGTRSFTGEARYVTHCLLVEAKNELILIDTGFGLKDIEASLSRLGVSSALLNPDLNKAETAYNQILSLGLNPKDVRHIILTHCDLDHAGGMSDFPWAKVHVHRTELTEAAGTQGLLHLHRRRYRHQQFSHFPHWEIYDFGGELWKGFENVRQLKGLSPEFLLIGTEGHTKGHCGIVIETKDKTVVHAGDSYFSSEELKNNAKIPEALRVFETTLCYNNKMRLSTIEKLKTLSSKESSQVEIFCSHDPVEFTKYHK